MDRFIGTYKVTNTPKICDLKSNMDRFIGATQKLKNTLGYYLKSNMDRFIEVLLLAALWLK